MQAELVQRAKGGDHDAFASIVASSIDGCYALAYRILRDPHRAQDATQQALLGAWRDLPSLRDVERFGLVDLARIEKLVLTHIAGEFFRLPIDDDQEKPS